MMARRPAGLLLAVLPLLGCVSPSGVNEDMLPFVQAGDNAGALSVLTDAKDDYGEKNLVLYQLERGMLQHYAGEFDQSNESFEIAKREAELHYTKSVTAEASTFLVNDNTRPYYGENFERALLQVFGAINYQALGLKDEALVEIRQLNFFLRQLVVDDEQDNSYRDDAFSHYLAGLFFEADGDLDEAWVAYEKALQAYASHGEIYGTPVPPTLSQDAALLAVRLGTSGTPIQDELVSLEGHLFGQQLFTPAEEPTGRVLVLHYNGRAPVKIDTFIDIAVIEGWPYVNKIDVEGDAQRDIARVSQIATSLLASDVVRIAFPAYRSVPRRIESVDVQPVTWSRVVRAELVTNVGAIAEQDLADRIHRVRAKAIARAIVKYALGKLAEQAAREAGGSEYGNLAGALVSVASAVVRTTSEVADKRAWFTVPDRILMARLDLAQGDHILKLTYRDGQGEIVREDEKAVTVEAGGLQFVILRTVE
jgi:hypothetical protein